jgi:hypothetical protein
MLTRAGIPFRAVRRGGAVASFEIEQTWVEAFAPYANYRGALLDVDRRSWVPLAPAYKVVHIDAGTDVLDDPALAADAIATEFLAQPRTETPLEFYRRKITEFLATSRPDLTLAQVAAHRSVDQQKLGLLPGTLPFKTISIQEEGPALRDSLRHKVRFVATSDGVDLFDVEIPASELTGTRVTLSYEPATVEDHITAEAFFGIGNTPAYLLHLRPVLKVGGVTRAVGNDGIQMGAIHHFSMQIEAPGGSFPIENDVLAGGFYALAFGSPNWEFAPPATPAADDTENPAADLIYGIAADYLKRWTDSEDALSDLLRVVNLRPALAEVMVGNNYNTTVLFGLPQALDWRGVFVDADLRPSDPVSSGADDTRTRSFLVLSGLEGSYQEGAVLESKLGADAVSAAKLIQLAHQAAIPIQEIDSANVAAVLPTLETDERVKQDISDAVQQGWTAMVPQGDLSRFEWTGIAYILRDTESGAGGYFISGSLAGSSSTKPEDIPPEERNPLKNPNGPQPNKDPNSAARIDVVVASDHQRGYVGQPLSQPMGVVVSDARGRPVEGATVRFAVLIGGGSFDASGAVVKTVLTDSTGYAESNVTLGTNTAGSPVYIIEHDGEKPWRVGLNQITASAVRASGDVFVSQPFLHYAWPGQPARIVKVAGDGNTAVAGTSGGDLLARIDDVYGNPISNEKLRFTSRPREVSDGPAPMDEFRLVLIPSSAPCPTPFPTLGECGQSQVEEPTGPFGVKVGTILGNAVGTDFRVDVTAPDTVLSSGQTSQTFVLHSQSQLISPTGANLQPTLVLTYLSAYDEQGHLLEAAGVGQTYSRLQVQLYKGEPQFDSVPHDVPAGTQCGLATGIPCWDVVPRGTLKVSRIVNGSGGETLTIQCSPQAGGITCDPTGAMISDGVYAATNVRLGPEPAVDRARITVTARIQVNGLNRYTGLPVQSPYEFDLGLGQRPRLSDAGVPLYPPDFPPSYYDHSVFGVRVDMNRPNLAFAYGGSDELSVTSNYSLSYTILPSQYVASGVTVMEGRLDEDTSSGQSLLSWLGSGVGSARTGTGQVTIAQGERFNRKLTYAYQVVLNGGSGNEIRSDRVPLAFLTSLYKYEFFPVRAGYGIRYDMNENLPIRRAFVEVTPAASSGGSVLQTDDDGFVDLTAIARSLGAPMDVSVLAQTGDSPTHPTLEVVDNYCPTGSCSTRPYEMRHPGVQWNGTRSVWLDEVAMSGWPTSDYELIRRSAPFAILDTLTTAQQIIGRESPAISLDLVTVYWSIHNSDAEGDAALGNIGGAHSNGGSAIFLSGKVDEDTDEYDKSVVLHEFGHCIQSQISRDDSVAGQHSRGDILDPRVAFSEGWADAVAGMLENPSNSQYVDSKGRGQSTTSPSFDREIDSNIETDSTPTAQRHDGYYSEASIDEVLWDIFDNGEQLGADDDPVSLGLQPLLQALGQMKHIPSFTTVFPFLNSVKAVIPSETIRNQVAEIARLENIPAGDEYGRPNLSRLYLDVPANGSLLTRDGSLPSLLQNFDFFHSIEPQSLGNRLGNWRFFQIIVDAAGCYEIEVVPVRPSPLVGEVHEVVFDYSIDDANYDDGLTTPSYCLTDYSITCQEDADCPDSPPVEGLCIEGGRFGHPGARTKDQRFEPGTYRLAVSNFIRAGAFSVRVSPLLPSACGMNR